MGYRELEDYEWFKDITFIPLTSKILSLKEQVELARKVPACDIFWSPNWNTPVWPVKAGKRVVTIHDVYHLAFSSEFSRHYILVMKLILKRAIRLARTVITVSEFSKQEISRLLGYKGDKIHVSHLSVSERFNKDYDFNKIDEKYILYVGNVKPHKNLELALRAFARIRDKRIRFYIVGKKDGFLTGYNNIDGLIKGLGDRVCFTGYVDDKQLKNYYANAALFLFPSRYEGFGLPILEAMKMGIPVLASNAASLPEVGGDAIAYFDPYNEDELVSCLDDFFMGKAIVYLDRYKDQLGKFDWNNTIKEHIDLLLA